MSWLKGLLLASLLTVPAVPAGAQIAGRPIEASAGAGIASFDARDFIQDGPGFTGSLGWRWSPALSFELGYLGSPTALDRTGNPSHTFVWTGGDVRWVLRDPSERVTPYFLTGFGFGRSQTKDLGLITRRGAPSLGLGLLYNLFGNQRAYLRLQVRDVMFREDGAAEFSHHVAATAGLQVVLGGKPKDQDLDGVRNWLDKCPDTPIGAIVGESGCPKDSDRDGVFDGLDKCPNTPRGCTVDKNGCPVDSDGDGVCDGLDKCPGTPKGATVDVNGCPMDSDGDGVLDGLDKCPGTPKGCSVDSTGCPLDADGDGVCDGLDQCPNTPAGLKVDVNGCPIEVSEKETELLDTGTIRIQNINFDTGKATIQPESFAVLDTVAHILLQYPALKIEIGGHTDNTGRKDKNMALSEARARAVLAYLAQKYPTLDATQFTVVGYGPTRPIAPNSSRLGRAKNRRVEFKVTNTEALKIEREKRHFLRRDEGAAPPPPAPAPADTTRRPAPGASAPRDTLPHGAPAPAASPRDTTKH